MTVNKRAKKILSILLCVCMVLQYVPMTIFAAGDSLCEYHTETITSAPDVDLPENDELFAYFVEQQLYGYEMSAFGTAARAGLNTIEQNIYDILKAKIENTAANGGSTAFVLTDVTDLKITWTNTELGVESIEDTTAVKAAFLAQFNLDSIITALLSDCPFDLYWYDKTSSGGVSMSYRVSISGEEVGGVTTWTSATVQNLTFTFKVVSGYQGGDTTTVTTDVSRVDAAKAAAQYVVDASKDKTAYEKLVAYKEYICGAVSYNTEAVADGYTGGYGDPWQLIYVFDDDSTTNVVCEGYSKAFQYLCDLGGLDCISVSGTMTGGTGAGGHMWNIVTLGGLNYLVDVTNCDTGTIGADDKLFLVGNADGSVESGYSFTIDSQTISFTYDADTIDLWSASELTLAQENYEKSSVIASGTCGENLTWSYDDTTKILTISGTGEMTTYNSFTETPWYDYAQSIEKIVVEEGVTGISMMMVYDYNSLKELSLPATLTNYGFCAVSTCRNLSTITLAEGNTALCFDEYGVLCNIDKTEIILAPVTLAGKYVAPDTLYAIHPFAFNFCQVTEVVLPNTVTPSGNDAMVRNIGCGAFGYCNALEKINIPDGVGILSGLTFYACSALTEITVPETVTELDDAFALCDELTVKFLGDAPTINSSEFRDCTVTAYYPAGNETWTADVMQQYGGTITWVAYEPEPTEPEPTEPEPTEPEPTEPNATSGTCGENLTWSYDDTTKILTISGTGEMTTYSSFNETPWYDYAQSIEKIVVEEGVTGLSMFVAFDYSALKEVSLPASLTAWGPGSIFGCENLATITLADGNTAFCIDEYGILYNCDQTEIILAPVSLTGKYVAPDTVNAIHPYAFNYCQVTEVVLPDTVIPTGNDAEITNIGVGAFAYCTALEKINIPEGVGILGAMTFIQCNSLKEITIPSTVTELGAAFITCENLETITFLGDAPEINSLEFRGCTLTAYYPAGNDTWTDDVKQQHSGTVTWKPYSIEGVKEQIGNLNEDSTEEEIADIVENIQQIPTEDLKDAMENDTDFTEKLDELEKKAGGDVIVTHEIKEEIGNQFDGAKVDYALLNDLEEETTTVTLVVGECKADEPPEVPQGCGKDTTFFSMTLEGVSNTKELKVPVRITLEAPSAAYANKVVIIHYRADGSHEVIHPTVNGTTLTFYLTGFSDFALTDVDPATCPHEEQKDSKCILCASQIAASVTSGDNTQHYTSLQSAVDAAKLLENSIVTLLANVELTESVTIGEGKFTIDLNGCAVSSTADTALDVSNDTDVTITDSVGGGTLAGSRYGIGNNGTLTVTGGLIRSCQENTTNPYDAAIMCNGNVTITGGTLEEGQLGVLEYFSGTLDLSGYSAADGLTIWYTDAPDSAMATTDVKLPAGYGLYDGEWNQVVGVVDAGTKLTVGLSHVHSWNYSTDGAAITATCNGSIGKCQVKTVTLTLTAPAELTYNGNVKTVTVSQSPADFFDDVPAVEYMGNRTDAGKHTAMLTYGGVTASLEFTIVQKALATDAVTLSETSAEYDGNDHTPTVTVMDGNKILAENTDYTVTITRDSETVTEVKSPGSYTITVSGKGNYSGNVATTFTMSECSHRGNNNEKWTHNADGETHSLICSVCSAAVQTEKHTGGTASCKDLAVCTDCGAEYGSLADHDWSVSYSWNADGSSCTATRSCSNDDAHSVTVYATITSEQTTAPTCEVMGETTYTATFDATWTETLTMTIADIPVKGHDEVTHEAQAPTCTEIGWDAYVTCTRCNHSTYVEKAALGHNDDDHDHACDECKEILSECIDTDDDAKCDICTSLLHLWGDANSDGVVNTRDARLILRYIVEDVTASALNLSVCDVNGDGEVNTRDVRLILRYCVEDITSFPVEK